jgi:hypothetical protein
VERVFPALVLYNDDTPSYCYPASFPTFYVVSCTFSKRGALACFERLHPRPSLTQRLRHASVIQRPSGFHPGPSSGFNIGWAEAVAIELGVHLLIHLGWHRVPNQRRFLVRSDNEGVVEIVRKGRCRTKESNDVLKQIYQLLAGAGISLKTEHVRSRDNVSDALSRGDVTSFLKGFPMASVKVGLDPPSHLQSRLQCL